MTEPIIQIETLSQETVFYYIDEEKLQHFKQIALHYHPHILHKIPVIFCELNIYVTVCNVWLALQARDNSYFLDEGRRMQYASIYFQLDYIEQHLPIKNFTKAVIANDEQLFYFAFFISIEIMTWLTEVMNQTEHQEMVQYFQDKQNLIAQNNGEGTTAFQQTMDFQKAYMKAMTHNVQQSNELDNHMKAAIQQTRLFLKQIDAQI